MVVEREESTVQATFSRSIWIERYSALIFVRKGIKLVYGTGCCRVVLAGYSRSFVIEVCFIFLLSCHMGAFSLLSNEWKIYWLPPLCKTCSLNIHSLVLTRRKFFTVKLCFFKVLRGPRTITSALNWRSIHRRNSETLFCTFKPWPATQAEIYSRGEAM